MKLFRLALALLAAPLAAPAQQTASRSLEIYGVLDVGVESVNNGLGTRTTMTSGISEGSRLGFRGREDLGGGWQALYTLESRLELNNGGISNRNDSRSAPTSLPPDLRALVDNGYLPTGTASLIQNEVQRAASTVNARGALFDRQAYVGLVTPVGAVLLGRQYTPGYTTFSFFDAAEAATAASPAQSYLGINPRADNAITHVIQGVGPVSTYFMYAAGESANSPSSAGSMMGGMVRYTRDALDLAIGGDAYKTQTTPVRTGLRNLVVAAAYTTGVWRFSYAHGRSRNPAAITDFTSPKVSVVDIDGTVGALMATDQQFHHLGARRQKGRHSLALTLNLVRDNRPSTHADVDHVGFVYRYALSPRTGIYIAGAHANNKGLARVGLNAAGTAGGFTRDFGVDSQALQFGIRHQL